MDIIVVANQKGGSGKTTTASNLAAYLALMEYQTLVIDLDPQGAATDSFGIDKGGLESTVYDVMQSASKFKDIILPTKIPNLFVAPTNIDLSGAEIELVNAIRRENILEKQLQDLDGYDYIIIDSPPSLGLLTVNALVASTHLLVPIQAEYLALQGMVQLLQLVDMVDDRFEKKIKRGFLVTMIDRRIKQHKEIDKEVRDYFKDRAFDVAIPRNASLSVAPSYGVPVCIHAPKSAGAKAYKELAKEVAAW